MEREIVLTSFFVKGHGDNRPGDFTTVFTPTLDVEGEYYLAFNRIISMSFAWTNINPGYSNQKIAYSSDDGKTYTDIDFPKGVWNYKDIDRYIKSKTKIKEDGKDVYPITFTFEDTTFRVIITLKQGYRLDLTKSNFSKLIGFKKEIILNETNIGDYTPNLSEDTDIINIHCDLISESLVDGLATDIIFSFGTGTLEASSYFVLEPKRIIFNPLNRTRISSIRIYLTDGLRRPIYLSNNDTAYSLILKHKSYL